MQEYKREKLTLESKVKELTKAATYHEDHLRVIDAWFKQVWNNGMGVQGNGEIDVFPS